MNHSSSTYGSAHRGATDESESTSCAIGQKTELQLLSDMSRYLQNYARERPEVAAMWCFGIGFVLGWRLKPW